MCGIVAGVSNSKSVVSFLVQGLAALEYRGYDSVGVALEAGPCIERFRSTFRVADLEKMLKASDADSRCGIGHTRWATHGEPSERNAHPHTSVCELISVAVVHNGIIENHASLRSKLSHNGYVFHSDTDTEVISHLLHQLMKSGRTLQAAVVESKEYLQGQYAFVAMSTAEPGVLCATRQKAPLLVGVADDGLFVASDVSALLSETNQVVYLQDGDVVQLADKAWSVVDSMERPVTRQVHRSELDANAVSKGQFEHYMAKEVHEQPTALRQTISSAQGLESLDGRLFGMGPTKPLGNVSEVLVLACGTSFHAGLVTKAWVEKFAKVPCHVEIASEFRYRHPILRPDTLVVAISQSGETADTKAAMDYAKGHGLSCVSICNVPESAIVRSSDFGFLTQVGPEVGVASTKAFSTQLAAGYLLALTLAKARNTLNAAQLSLALAHLMEVPALVTRALACDNEARDWAQAIHGAANAIYLGRGPMSAIAMEGALKLKEITYIHAEAYPAGELKHGPLALIDEHTPVVISVRNDELVDKVLANIEEVLARKGAVYAIVDAGIELPQHPALKVLGMPLGSSSELSPFTHVIAHQLLSYHAAVLKGTDVDKPRNLAKSVTVE